MKKLFALGMLVALGTGAFGCSYGAIAVSQDGTIWVARNDMALFGALRKIYSCKPNGAAMTCTQVEGAP